MVSCQTIDLVDSVIDEVALEGLDGITVEALWLRLANRLRVPLPFPRSFMLQVWSICVQVREFAFYELEVAREKLVIFDRYQFVDPDLGIILEPENVPADIYPHCPINDTANGIIGSCSTYHTRKDITELARNLSLDMVQVYGQKLVIVASQTARNHALMGVDVSPILDFNVIQYCFLERIGRSRYHGEVTQGKLSLNALKEDPKSLFYHRKLLLQHKLITKQLHHQKAGGHSCNGSLLHLPRFFVERKPKIVFLAEEVIKILKSKPNYMVEYDELKRKLGIENSIKKLFQTSFFQKAVKTDVRVPYRTLYPNATPAEWQKKSDPKKEKQIKVVQLLYPNIDLLEALNKEDAQEEYESEEMSLSSHKFSTSYLKQTNKTIDESESEGVCQGGLCKTMGLTKLQSRTILRNLVRRSIAAIYMNDVGRQRTSKYVSKRYEKGSKLSKQFQEQVDKIKQLRRQIVNETDDLRRTNEIVRPTNDAVDTVNEGKGNTENDRIIVAEPETSSSSSPSSSSVSKVEEEEGGGGGGGGGTVSNNTTKERSLTFLFLVTNRILYKYRLTKRANRYRRTFCDVASTKTVTKEESKSVDRFGGKISESVSRNEEKSEAEAYKNIKVDLTVIDSKSDEEKPDNEISGFMEDMQKGEKEVSTNISYRLLRRANMIIETVKEHQVIDDTTKLMKMINEEEDKEGYDVKIDKKSLVRLLKRLSRDNLVKHVVLRLSANNKEKRSTLICEPNIDLNSSMVQSMIEQAKLKFYLMISQKPKSPARPSASNASNASNEYDAVDANKSEAAGSKCGPKASRKYGYSPKFVRMQTLHQFLFYLVYDHPGEQTLSKSEQVQMLRDKNVNVSDELAEELSTIYNTDDAVSWKTFVPPLTKNKSWPRGWTLMCDALLRLPLSVFLKIHYVSYTVPEIDDYVNHPIRKHYLVRDLPIEIRNSLFHSRKYIFHIHETVTRLCYLGLVQFGPQKLKEKDQIYIFVNRKTELMDTTSSEPDYHRIEDKPYPVVKYNFDGLQLVEKYWYDMWNTCINTPLGGRLVVQGKDIVLEDLNKKSDMIQSLVPRTPQQAVELDTGKVPGDRRGAAGIDSACFAHLKRNWNWAFNSSLSPASSAPPSSSSSSSPTTAVAAAAAAAAVSQREKTGKKRKVTYEREAYLAKIKSKPIRFTEFSGLKTVSGPPSVNVNELRRKTNSKEDSSSCERQQLRPFQCSQKSARQKSYVRRVLPRKSKGRRRIKYDEVDYRALQRMHKLRVDWDPHEDKILLICKVAMVYLCPNPRKQVITFSAIRDVLRTYSYSSYNKTSRACQRRLLYMLKQQRNVNTVTLGVEELRQNFFLDRRFGGIVDKLKEEYTDSVEHEKRVTEEFKSLVAYVAKKYYDISDVASNKPLSVPNTVQEFNLFYKIVHPMKPFYNRGFTRDVRNTTDIHSAVVNSVIHSSMCCGKDRRSWAYQLFKIYQQYPESLLRNAMAKIRNDQMVTVKKNQVTAVKKYGNYMPMSSSQYQLSNIYIYKLQTKWPYSIFNESYDVFLRLSEWYCRRSNETDHFNGIEVLPVTGGIVTAMQDYMMRNQIDFDVEIPDQVIMLDPRLKEKDETYFRIAQRYQDVLASLDNLKFTQESKPGMDTENKTSCQDVEVIRSSESTISTGNKRRKSSEEATNDSGEPVRKKKKKNNNNKRKSEGSKEDEETSENRAELVAIEEGSIVDDDDDDGDHHHRKQTELFDPSRPSAVHDDDSKENGGSTQVGGAAADGEHVYTRVSEILKRSSMRQNCSSSRIDETDVQKRYTRIALLRMREELNELTVADSHHAHEYFVVNMFKVFYSLQRSSEDSVGGTNDSGFKHLPIPPELIPLTLSRVNDLIEEIGKFAVYPKTVIPYSDFKKTGLNSWFKYDHVDAVYNFVRDKRELGASVQELMDEFHEIDRLGEDLRRIVSLLTEHRLFLRAGVTTVRYIHHCYADSWLINSYKICRNEKEALVPVSAKAVYSTETRKEEPSGGREKGIDNEVVTRTGGNSDRDSDRDAFSDEESEENAGANRKSQRKRIKLSPHEDHASTKATPKQLDTNAKQEIKVAIRPWIRIDGAVNRRVLDRMLGSVLSYCLTHPGIPLVKVQNRFVPPLQPCHTRELVEILVTMGCLRTIILKKPRVTLFSKPSRVEPKSTNSEWAVEEDIFLEPTSGATLKFGVFLSTKMYSTDFVK